MERFSHWLDTRYYLTPEALGIYRILFASYFLFINGLPDFSWVGEHPQVFYNPPIFSLGIVFSDFPNAVLFHGLNWALGILFVLLLFGVFTRVVSVLITTGLLVGLTFAYSYGKIDHMILAYLTPLLMAFAGWGNAYSYDASRQYTRVETRGWPIAFMLWMLCFAFFSAGVLKLLGGWLSPDSQAVRGHLIENFYLLGRQKFLASVAMGFESTFFWELLDWVTVAFEICFIAALFNRTVFMAFVVAAVFFHGMNLLVLNIPFMGDFGTYLLLAPLERLVTFVRTKGMEARLRWCVSGKVGILGVVVALFYVILMRVFVGPLVDSGPSAFNMLTRTFTSDVQMFEGSMIHFLALVVTIMLLVPSVKKQWQRRFG